MTEQDKYNELPENINPPAFPNRGDNTPRSQFYDGMSLRDWFAGQAMQGLLSNSKLIAERTIDELAFKAYQQADAMLAERQKGTQP